MKSRFSTAVLIALFTLIGFNGGYILGQSPLAPFHVFGSAAAAGSEAFAPFWEVWDLVHTRYFEQPVDDALLMEGAIAGMLEALEDRHTVYLPPEDEELARTRMDGEFEGIGAEVEDVDGNITIVSPIDGSPAAKADLQPGDILRAADGVDLTGMDVQEAAGLVRGPKGTVVVLVIERDGERFSVDIVRDVIPLVSVRSRMLEDDIAYVRLSQFGNRSAEELEEQVATLLAENPVGLILDLRRNPGGGLGTAVSATDLFLPEGTILVERFGSGRDEVFTSEDGDIAEEIPLVVLIDEGSASASEVLAGAIHDRERGVLIGQTSFGKGTVQTWHGLSNGGGVRITIARWLTPDETWVHEDGLVPDYIIPLPENGVRGDADDTQLQAAIDYLLGETIISAPAPDSEE